MFLTHPSQLIIKQSDALPEQMLLLNPDGDGLAQTLIKSGKTVSVHTSDYRQYLQLKQSNFDGPISFGVSAIEADQKPNSILLRLPKSKLELTFLAAQACALMAAKSDVFIVGENKAGIRSAAKAIAQYCYHHGKIASGSHCQLLHFQTREQKPFDLSDWILTYSAQTPDGTLPLCSYPGVFNHGKLDQGTQLLFSCLPEQPNGRILDFGCGDGVIGCFLGLRNPNLELELVDTNATAIAASNRSLTLNKLQAKVIAADGINELPGHYDLIVSNPPYHQSIRQELNTSIDFIKAAAEKLLPKGRLFIVANHHLPYGDALEKAFGRVNILTQNNQFKVYCN